MAVNEATEDAGLDPSGYSCLGEDRKELGSSLRWNQRQEVCVRKGGGEEQEGGRTGRRGTPERGLCHGLACNPVTVNAVPFCL